MSDEKITTEEVLRKREEWIRNCPYVQPCQWGVDGCVYCTMFPDNICKEEFNE